MPAKVEAPPGFEPGNRGFAVPCLTTWLWRRKKAGAWGRNRTNDTRIFSPLLYQLSYPGTLGENGAGNETRTRYLHLGKVALYRMSYARKVATEKGLEPSTSGVTGRRSNRLNYSAGYGGNNRTRTCDPLLVRQVL